MRIVDHAMVWQTPAMAQENRELSHGELLQLKRWNTPTIYNGWEQITKHDVTKHGINLEETRDFMPQMGPMVGYAVTLVIEPSSPKHRQTNPNAWSEYREQLRSLGASRSRAAATLL